MKISSILFPLIIILIHSTVLSKKIILANVSLEANDHGIALAIETNKPLTESFQNYIKVDKNVFEAQLLNVYCDLHEEQYTSFQASSPVKKVVISNLSKSVKLKVILQKMVNKKIRTKYQGNHIYCILSTESYLPFTWKTPNKKSKTPLSVQAQSPYIPTPPKEEKVKKTIKIKRDRAVIKDIELMRRGSVEKLVIDIGEPVLIRAKRKKGALVAVFNNTINGLEKTEYKFPGNSNFRKLTVKESKLNGVDLVGIVIYKSLVSILTSLVQIKPGKIVIYAIGEKPSKSFALSHWSSSLQPMPDLARDKESLLNSTLDQEESPKRVVVIHEIVNLRDTPSIGNQKSIIKKLRMGSMGTVLSRKGKWYYLCMDEDTTMGWIHARMVIDSTDVSEHQWQRIGTIKRRIRDYIADRDSLKIKIDKQQAEASLALPSSEKLFFPNEGNEKEEFKIKAYSSFGRDPYIPLSKGNYIDIALPSIEHCKLVGILYDDFERIALLETKQGNGEAYALKENDTFANGRVRKIGRDRVVFLLNNGGYMQRYILRFDPNPPALPENVAETDNIKSPTSPDLNLDIKK